MRQKNTLAISAILLFSALFGSLFSLAAQDAMNKPQITIGLGFEASYPFLTEAGQDALDEQKARGLDDTATYVSLGGRIPFTVAFELAKPYSIGFGIYASAAYQVAQLTGALDVGTPALGPGIPAMPAKRDATLLYERAEITFSPVFYNELALGKSMALSLAFGPTFALSFGDKSTLEVDGSNVLPAALGGTDTVVAAEKDGTFERNDSFQLSAGFLVDLGFQYRFTEMMGVGANAFLKVYFVGQKTARTADTWAPDQNYLGNVGGSISFLLFL